MSNIAGYSVSPRALALVFMLVVTIPSVVLLPLVEFQPYFWAGAIITFLIGDSITTALLGRFGLEEQEQGYTRWACGAEPSFVCSFGTRGIAFSVVGVLYLVVVRYGLGTQFNFIVLAALSLPLILAAGGIAATVLNTWGIVRAAQRGDY